MTPEEFRQQIPSSIVLPPEDLSSLTDEELWNFLSDFELYLKPNGGPVMCAITGVMYSEEDWKEMERKMKAELDARAADRSKHDITVQIDATPEELARALLEPRRPPDPSRRIKPKKKKRKRFE